MIDLTGDVNSDWLKLLDNGRYKAQDLAASDKAIAELEQDKRKPASTNKGKATKAMLELKSAILDQITADIQSLVSRAELDDLYSLATDSTLDSDQLLRVIEGGHQVVRALLRNVWDSLPTPDDTESFQVQRAAYWAGETTPTEADEVLRRSMVLRSLVRFFKKHLLEADDLALITLAMLTASSAEGAYLAGQDDTWEAAKGLVRAIGLG